MFGARVKLYYIDPVGTARWLDGKEYEYDIANRGFDEANPETGYDASEMQTHTFNIYLP